MDFIIFIINFFFSLAYIILIIRAVLPWITSSHDNLVSRLTDPLLGPLRQALPPQKIGMDVSPAVAIILIWLIQKTLALILKSLL